MEDKRKELPFSFFVKNGIGFLRDAKSIWNSLSQSKDVEDLDIVQYQEMHKIALLARSAESFIKALLLVYDEIVLFPVFLLIKKVETIMNKRLPRIIKISRRLKERAITIESLERLEHHPVLYSEIPQIFLEASKILHSIGEKDLANVYSKIYNYLDSMKKKDKTKRLKERKFQDIEKLRLELTTSIDIPKYIDDVLEILREAINSELIDEKVRESIKYLIENPHILKYILNLTNIGIQELIDLILIADYLSDAATEGFYPSDINAQNYLNDIKENQRFLMDYLSTIGTELYRLSKNPEFMETLEDYYRYIGSNIIS